MAKKVGSFMRYGNLLREALSYCLLGTALWQIFSIDPENTEVVDEIMNFAALLIVIELDDFLMASPTQMRCKQFYGDDYLTYNFSREEIQTIAYKGLPIKQHSLDAEDTGQKLTCGEKVQFFLESLISFVFKFMVVLIIILVNVQIIEQFSIDVAKENITSKLRRFASDDTTSEEDGETLFELENSTGLFEYH